MSNTKRPSSAPNAPSSVPKSTVPMRPAALRDLANSGEALEREAHETALTRQRQAQEGDAATLASARAQAEAPKR